jgi:transposase-like protein
MALPEIFTNSDKAREHLEAKRWPNGPICPHCGNADPERIKLMKGKSHRPGLYQCNECREPFTVTVGSVFERSKIPLHTWVYATYLMNSSKKGMSAHQMHRMLGVTYKTAWFMAHRIRESMRDANPSPLGGSGKVVEADETYFGNVEKPLTKTTRGRPFVLGRMKPGGGPANKRAVVSLVERGGSVRSFHVDKASLENVQKIVFTNVSRESALHTDESRLYTSVGAEFAGHHTVKHSAGEYVRYEAERLVHTNTIEGFFSIFKRGMKGVYQHCGEKHLHRYLAEFDFRYNHRIKLGFSDAMRADIALSQIGGKRLTYRRPDKAPIPEAEMPPF